MASELERFHGIDGISPTKYGMAVYAYFRRRDVRSLLNKINGKTWHQASKDLNLSIPSLFILLSHSIRAGIVREVRIV